MNPNLATMRLMFISVAMSMRPRPRQYCGKTRKTSFRMEPTYCVQGEGREVDRQVGCVNYLVLVTDIKYYS